MLMECNLVLPIIRLILNSNALNDDQIIGDLLWSQAHCFLIVVNSEDVTVTEFHLDPSDLAPEYD